MAEEQGAPPEPLPNHSRAFETLVQGADDIVGLIAYAKYKESVREGALQGNIPEPAARNLTPVMVNVLRSAAEQMIAQVVGEGIAAATPEIQQTAAVNAVDSSKQELSAAVDKCRSDTLREIREERVNLERHVTKRTGFWGQFGTNLAAWIVSLAIVVLVILSRQGRNIEDTLIDAAQPTQHQQIGNGTRQ